MGVVGQDGGEREQAGAGGDGGQGGRGEAQGQRGHGQGQTLELGQVLHLELLLETHTGYKHCEWAVLFDLISCSGRTLHPLP